MRRGGELEKGLGAGWSRHWGCTSGYRGRRGICEWGGEGAGSLAPLRTTCEYRGGKALHLRAGWLHILHELKRLLHIVVLHVVDDQVETRLRNNVHERRKHLCRRGGVRVLGRG
jgi:hypothetical protein